MDAVRIVAFNRKKSQFKPLEGMHINWIEDFQVDISSAAVRKKIIEGHLPSKELTPEVLEYIYSNQLYGDPA